MPDRVTVFGFGDRLIPDGPVAFTVTVPAKPPRLDTTMLDEDETPGNMLRLAGLADTEKSGIDRAMLGVWISFACDPVTVIVNVPVGVLVVVVTVTVIDRELFGVSVTVVWFRNTLGPVGEMPIERLMVPLYPLRLVRVTVEVPEYPW